MVVITDLKAARRRGQLQMPRLGILAVFALLEAASADGELLLGCHLGGVDLIGNEEIRLA